jgi:putative lipoprotein (rSAM/lipoprotein system)
MKTIYRPFIKGTNWALAGLVALLGLSNCAKLGDGDDSLVLEYGVPWASYAIKGTVVDKATQNPISGIEVKIDKTGDLSYPEITDNWTSKTNENGEFKLSNTPNGASEKGVPVIITDIDGEANGSFEADTIYVDYKNAQHIGGDNGWFKGELTAIVNVELETKKAE